VVVFLFFFLIRPVHKTGLILFCYDELRGIRRIKASQGRQMIVSKKSGDFCLSAASLHFCPATRVWPLFYFLLGAIVLLYMKSGKS